MTCVVICHAETNHASVCILCRRPTDETNMCNHCQQQLQGGLWFLCLSSCLSQTCNLRPLYSKYVYTSSKLVCVWVRARARVCDFTVWFFTDGSFVCIALVVFHYQISMKYLNDDAGRIIIWFPWRVCTVRGIATVQPVVRSSRSRCCYLQSDIVLFGIRPVPHNTLIDIITANLSQILKLLWNRIVPMPLWQNFSCHKVWDTQGEHINNPCDCCWYLINPCNCLTVT